MTFEIFPTTTEHIISATDAVLLQKNGCTDAFVSLFIDVPEEAAKNALKMSEQLGLIIYDDVNGLFKPISPFAKYLASGNEKQKAVIIRLLLEQYEPYRFFKDRLIITGFVQVASEQVRAFHNISAHREVIKDTLTSLGTYSQSLISEGAGLYKIAEEINNKTEYFLNYNEIVSRREQAEAIVRKLLGQSTVSWIDPIDTLDPLVTAYQKLEDTINDPRGPILYAGNAFESFLVKLANHHNVSLNNASGINSKIDKLSSASHLNTKFKNIGKYIGHIRNACEHGIDPEIGQSWQISRKTSHEFVHVTISCMDVIVDSLNGIYKV